MTRHQILQAFERIRVWQQGDKRAPHKPLLILFALGRVQRDEPPMMEFSQIDGLLKALIDEFGPTGAGKHRHFPFWHLASDKDGGIWRLDAPSSILHRPRGATPTLTELRQHHVGGGFSSELQDAFKREPGLIQEVARLILDANFPETIHPDIVSAVGLSLHEINIGKGMATVQERRSRAPGFRERVLRAYEYRCCVCGYSLRLGQQVIGLEAAHIKWFQAGGPDIEKNGLALCSMHHKIFDLGAFTIKPDNYRVVFSQHVSAHDRKGQALLSQQDSEMIHPQSGAFLPEPEYLVWHHEQVFKKPARDYG